MIDYKALKIGNYILNEVGVPCIVNSLVYKGENNCLINENSSERYTPVILTEEIVLKCGFHLSGKDSLGKHFRHTETSLRISALADKFYFVYCDKIGDLILEDKISIRIDYLHRLQNLFHCLSGGKQLIVNI